MTEEEKTAEKNTAENKGMDMGVKPQGIPTEIPNNTPGGVVIIAILYIIGGIMWLIYPFFYMWALAGYFQNELGYVPWANVFLNTTCCWIGSWLIGFLYFGIAGGLMKGMKGAWLWAVIFAIIGLFNVPIGTIVSIIILIYLFRPAIRNWFKN